MGRKDKVLKDYFSDPERFCDFINGAVLTEARIQRADEKVAKAASGKERSEDSSGISVGTFGGGPAKAGADGSFLLWHRALESEPAAASDAGVSAGTGEVSGLFSGLPSDSDSALPG